MEIDNFNNTIDIWIKDLKSYSMDQLLNKPDEKSWSLGQLYMHLIEETNWYNDQIEIALNDTENAGNILSSDAKKLFEAKSFADKKIQGDPLMSENVKQPLNKEQLTNDFKKLKISTNAIWKKIVNVKSSGKSEFPGFGYFNPYEWFQFSEMHMRHHLKQKRRIEDHLKFEIK